MTRRHAALRALYVAALAFVLTACATAPQRAVDPPPSPDGVLRSLQLDRALEDRVLALDPEHISGDDVRTTLSVAPTPHVLLLHGGIYPVHLAMTSFAEFLIGMGYPEGKIRRDDGVLDSVYSYSPYGDSKQLAGAIAWYYEHEGLRPMMVGHSQGGVQAVKVLYELAGTFSDEIPVWNPRFDRPEDRVMIVDPLSGATRPVVGLSASYVSVVGAGGAALLLPNQWSMLHRVRSIPDTVEDFTGFTISIDLVALSFPGSRGASEYHHNGTAKVRNVILPSWYNHVVVPVTRELATREPMRDWLNAYAPGRDGQAETMPPGPNDNALWAADVWYSIKKHWCLEAQRLIRAKRALLEAH